MKLSTILLMAILSVSQCSMPPVSNCTPGHYDCHSEMPVYCNSDTRWMPMYPEELRCDRQGMVCVVADNGRSSCAQRPVTDGGVSDER